MKTANVCVAIVIACLIFQFGAAAQEATNQSVPSVSTSSQATFPRIIKFSGTLFDAQERPLSGPAGVTFALYAQQSGGAALWMETQNVRPDAKGNYTVLLGAESAHGVPEELFVSGEARWLGVQPEWQVELPRILLVSVPYALKAGDAATLGGLPPSAFLAASAQLGALAAQAQTASATVPVNTQPVAPQAASVGGTGTANFIPLWTNSTTQGNSLLFQKGSAVQFPATGTATALKGFNSNAVDLIASAFKKGGPASNQLFRWQAEPAGNNTASPSGTLNLLFASGAGTPAETGLSINTKGQITFAFGQAFPTVTGNETVTGNLSASQLISTVANGTAPLKVTSTTLVPNLNASFLGGLSAGSFAQLAAANTFGANQTISTAAQFTTGLVVSSSHGHGGSFVAGTDISGVGYDGVQATGGDSTGIAVTAGGNGVNASGGRGSNGAAGGAGIVTLGGGTDTTSGALVGPGLKSTGGRNFSGNYSGGDGVVSAGGDANGSFRTAGNGITATGGTGRTGADAGIGIVATGGTTDSTLASLAGRACGAPAASPVMGTPVKAFSAKVAMQAQAVTGVAG